MTKTDSKDLCTVANDGICRFDQTTVTLVPASFPEENQKAIVTVGLCQFGLMLETNYSRFFKFFNDQITLEKWGNKRLPPKNKLNLLNPVSQTEVEKLIDNRIDILSTIVNHFYQSVFPKVKIPTIGVLFTLEENYVAEYSPENHQIKVGYEVIYYSLSDLNKEFILKKDIASTLYHEIRHIDQVILCLRFMHGRGQNPISKLFKQANGEKSQWIDDALIPVAKNFDKTDPVQQGTNGKVTKGHRHYHCAVQLYASMFGDPEEEIKFNPNIYDDVDYPIPLEVNALAREKLHKAYMQKLEDYRIENQFSMKTESMIKQGLEQITTAYLKEDYGEKLFEEKDAYIVEDKMKGSIEG